MLITLDVVSYNGSPLGKSLAASFDELGGAIGRAAGNQLELPDPDRTVSRVHAQVVFRHGAFAVVDRGSNPISVNGRPLGNGRDAPLRSGDELQVGGYAIRVSVAPGAPSAAQAADPFADFGAPAARPAPRSAAATSVDPLAAFGVTAPSPGAAASGGIPDDWNPFAPDVQAPATRSTAPQPGRGGADFGLELGAAAPPPLVAGMPIGAGAGETSLDALFGLGPPSGADPLANSALDAPIAQPNMAASADPMRSLNRATRGSAAAAPDQLSDLQRPFSAPPTARAPAAPAVPVKPAGSAVLSWNESGAQNRTIIRAAKSVPAVPEPAPAAPAAPVAPIIAATAPAPALTVRASGAAAPEVDALSSALCAGLGVDALPGGALTPASMRLIGELLHEATRGTVELLIARAALKREVRAEVTKIVARENNPLKFSPNVEVALNHLLGPPTRGFLAPAPAMRDAYDDLRAHQFAFLAGMRAALEGVLKRFDPAVLEGKLTHTSILATLLPSSRKARMWEVFQELYAQISAEASDDFHELFGKAFLRAYEAHIDELTKDAP